MVKPRVLILRVAGTNCDNETEWAFRLAGAEPERVHINRIKSGEKKISDYQALVIPGGFSYGDDISAGKVLVNEIKHNMGEDIDRFIRDKKPLIGICNGFQVLVKAGLLPWQGKQAVTLGWNDSARFEDRWVYLKVEESASPFLKDFPPVIKLPVAHAEGKFIVDSDATLKKIDDEKLVFFRYCSPDGGPAEYPLNPNGSTGAIAGLTSADGMIAGMMPHPERALLKYFYPGQDEDENAGEYGHGFRFFKNVVEYLK